MPKSELTPVLLLDYFTKVIPIEMHYCLLSDAWAAIQKSCKPHIQQ